MSETRLSLDTATGSVHVRMLNECRVSTHERRLVSFGVMQLFGLAVPAVHLGLLRCMGHISACVVLLLLHLLVNFVQDELGL